MKVMILGCGPAGLFAAHAAAQFGCEVAIISKKRKSEMFGAQYLHRPIPGLSEGSGHQITYSLAGTPESYRRKVYGDKYDGSVSPEDLEEDHMAWDIREAYSKAWMAYAHLITNALITSGFEVQEALANMKPDVVFSTVPAPLLCLSPNEHQFSFQKVYAVGDAPERGIFCPVRVANFHVLCNGTADTGWYRASNVFGYSTAEWPGRRKPPIEGVAEVTKPLSNDCDCLPEVTRLGRYGRWQKGILSHSAYFDTADHLECF